MKRIDKLRPVIMKISLIISLFTVFILMNFSMKAPIFEELGYLSENEDMTEIVRTLHRKKKVEKPPIMKKVEFDNRNVSVDFADSIVTKFDTMVVVIDTTMDIEIPIPYPSGPSKPSRPGPLPPEEDTAIRFPGKRPAFGDDCLY